MVNAITAVFEKFQRNFISLIIIRLCFLAVRPYSEKAMWPATRVAIKPQSEDYTPKYGNSKQLMRSSSRWCISELFSGNTKLLCIRQK